MGINQLTFVKSCRQLVRLGSLSLCENYYLYSKDTLFLLSKHLGYFKWKHNVRRQHRMKNVSFCQLKTILDSEKNSRQTSKTSCWSPIGPKIVDKSRHRAGLELTFASFLWTPRWTRSTSTSRSGPGTIPSGSAASGFPGNRPGHPVSFRTWWPPKPKDRWCGADSV